MARNKPKPFHAIHHPAAHRGVYTSWDQVQPLVSGVSKARFKGFFTSREAEDFARYGDGPRRVMQSVGQPSRVQKPARQPLRSLRQNSMHSQLNESTAGPSKSWEEQENVEDVGHASYRSNGENLVRKDARYPQSGQIATRAPEVQLRPDSPEAPIATVTIIPKNTKHEDHLLTIFTIAFHVFIQHHLPTRMASTGGSELIFTDDEKLKLYQ